MADYQSEGIKVKNALSTQDERLILLGRKIKFLRKLRKISQLNLSVKLGITREHLSKIERGAAYPSIKILFSILDILNIDFADLFNIDTNSSRI